MTPLQSILATYRSTSKTEREKGSYFEELIRSYFRNEPKYRDLHSDVWLFGDFCSMDDETISGKQLHLITFSEAVQLKLLTDYKVILLTTDKDSGLTNDANLWATETLNNPKYPLVLFLRVVTVSLETMKVVNGLPGLDLSVEFSS